MMIKNIKKTTLALFSICAVLSFQACKLDNYDRPNATLTGKIIDAETNESVQTQYKDGTRIRLYEFYNQEWSVQPTNFWVKQDGSFENKAVFAGKYKVLAEGAFHPIDVIEVDISGMKNLDIKVTPYLRLTINATPVTDGVTLSTKVTRTASSPKINTITFLCGETPYVDKSTFAKKADKDVSKLQDSEIVSEAFTETLTGLQKGKTYYVRAGALAINPANHYNYSEIIKVVIP